MDIRNLQAFEKVASLLNFTRAAEELGYAQSSITGQIRTLEEEVGQPLFERLGKRVVLTEAGRRFRPYAARMLALATEARQMVQEVDLRGTLRIGASESLCGFRLPPVLRQYRARFPNVQLTLETGICHRLHEGLRTGQLDVGLFLDEAQNEPDMVVRPLIQEPISLVTYPWHPLAAAERVLPEDLRDQPIIHTEPECSYRLFFDRQLLAVGVEPRVIMQFNSLEPIKQCVMAGLGVTLLPRIVCAAELENGSLVELPWAGPPVPMVTQLVVHKDKWISPPLGAFLEMVQQALIR